MSERSIDAAQTRQEATRLVAEQRFCKSGPRLLGGDERAWCDVVDFARCPGMKSACAKVGAAPADLALPTLPGLAALPWILALVGFFILALAVVRRFAVMPVLLDRRRSPGKSAPVEVEVTDLPVETDVEQLLARAEQRAATGDLAAALATLRAALLRALERLGRIQLARWKTNGDYLRELRGAPTALRDPTAQVMTMVERAQFGGELPEGGAWSRALGQVRALARGLVALVVVAGLAAGLAGCRGRDGGLEGREAALALLSAHGTTVRMRSLPLSDLEPENDPILVLPDASLTDAETGALLAWARAGGKLLSLGHDGVEHAAAVAATPPSSIDPASDAYLPAPQALQLAVPGQHRLREPEGAHVIVGLPGAAYALELASSGSSSGSRIVLCADDHLLTNAALVSGDDAAILLTLVAKIDRLQIVDANTGVEPSLPPVGLWHAHLVPLFAQLLVVLGLFGLWRGTAFGRRRDPAQPGRRRFAEHVLACAAVYARGRQGRHALGLYAALALERLRQRLRPRGASLTELAEAVAARTDRPLGAVMAALVDGHDALATTATHERDDAAVAAVATLAQLLHDTKGAS